MSMANGDDPGDARGIERLRVAIERVASDIEERPVDLRASRTGRPLRLLVVVASALIVLFVGFRLWIGPARSAEVEVLVLRVHGRDMRARIVDDAAPATIIVIPNRKRELPVGAVACLEVVGGVK